MKTELFTTSELKSRGWTDSLIRKFLEEHDETRPNPKYSNAGSPMKLYRRDRVERIEKSEEFREAKRKADDRKVSAKKAVETKLKKMQDYLDNLIIEVPKMKKETLIAAARQNSYLLDLPDHVEFSDERNCVNFLRHCETKYESELANIAGKTGASDAYYEIKEKVLNAIAEQYDWLVEECDRQILQMMKKRYSV